MTEIELIQYLESDAAWDEIERCWLLCIQGQLARTGKGTNRNQMVDLMLGRVVEEIRTLPDSLQKGLLLGNLLKGKEALDHFLSLIPTAKEARYRASAIVSGRVAEILRAVFLYGPGEHPHQVDWS